jgi:Ca2+-binding RTX toxin-like protein
MIETRSQVLPLRSLPTVTYVPLFLLCACAAQEATSLYEPRDIDGIEEAAEGLNDLSAQCDFASGVMTLGLHGGDIALIQRSSLTSAAAILVNGFECGVSTVATANALKRIQVSELSAGDQTLILDYSVGYFALGSGLGAGVVVDPGSHSSADGLKVIGSNAADRYVFGASGIDVNGDRYPDISAAAIEEFVVNLGLGNDSFSGAGNLTTGAAFAHALQIYGGDGNDTIQGGDGEDLCDGGAGNDILVGGTATDGADTLRGGDGTDTADYGARGAPVTVSLDGVANDGADGGAEADNVELDVETIRGTGGDDQLTGGTGSQTIYGGAGDDLLAGGPGADALYGEAGDDLFDEGDATSGADVFSGGLGLDTVDYSARGAAVTVIIDAAAGDGQSGEGDRVALDVENVIGGGGNDRLTGSAVANVLVGGGGDDILLGGAGDDVLRGGEGNDRLEGGLGNDTLDAEDAPYGNDTMLGGAGIDLVTYAARSGPIAAVMDGSTPSGEGGEGDKIGIDVEHLRAGAGDDEVTGNALDNVLEGGDGVDTLNGGAGDDVIDGDSGEDIIDCGDGDADVLLDTTTASADSCEL